MRGLSKLQKSLLTMAAERDRLYYADICQEYYGWKPMNSNWRHLPGVKQFSREDIGRAEYNRVMATISRTCLRLHKRGLVTCLVGASSRWSAIQLTEKGREWAAANTREGIPSC